MPKDKITKVSSTDVERNISEHIKPLDERELEAWAEQQLDTMLQVDQFKAMGKENDPLFQTLVFLGQASARLSYGHTVMSNYNRLPAHLLAELSGIQRQVHDFKEKLRARDYCPQCNGIMLKEQRVCANCAF